MTQPVAREWGTLLGGAVKDGAAFETALRGGGTDPALLYVMVSEWLARHARPTTRLTYQGDIAVYLHWCLGVGLDPLAVHATAEEGHAKHGVCGATFTAYELYLRARTDVAPYGHYSATSRIRMVSVVSSFYRFHVLTGGLPRHPRDDYKTAVAQPEPALITAAQAQAMADQAQAWPWPPQGRLAALFHLLACDLRTGVLTDALVGDLDLAKGTLQTGGAHPRQVPLSPAARAAVAAYLHLRGWPEADQPLIASEHGHSLKRAAVAKSVRNLCERSGVRRLSPDQLRLSLVALRDPLGPGGAVTDTYRRPAVEDPAPGG